MPMASFYWAGPTLGPSSQVALLPCPDGGWPLYEKETQQVLAYALEAARTGRFVEVGCHAGHGRTGMALAALMILAGLDAEAAMLKVWNVYCEQAIETHGQERYLMELEHERSNDGY
jgi:protein-tyrosine phosphatase